MTATATRDLIAQVRATHRDYSPASSFAVCCSFCVDDENQPLTWPCPTIQLADALDGMLTTSAPKCKASMGRKHGKCGEPAVFERLVQVSQVGRHPSEYWTPRCAVHAKFGTIRAIPQEVARG